MSDRYGYIAIETLLDFCENSIDHAVTPNDFMRMPRVRVPERKTGRWIWSPNGLDWNLGAWCCSECKFKAETWWANDEKYNPLMCSGGHFCGNCGAKMGDTNYELY